MRQPKTRKMITLPQELARRVDDYRFENRFRTESEALTKLVESGLVSEAQASATTAAQ